MKKTTTFATILISILSIHSCTSSQRQYTIENKISSARVEFALSELKSELDDKSYSNNGGVSITFQIDSTLSEQAYRIESEKEAIAISGGDDIGVMYGILDLSEQLSIVGSLSGVENRDESPYIEKRGVKFNIPLDARLPSYDDTGDCAQENIANVWERDFWYEYLDELAKNRYNVLSLWTKHPFPSMIKLKDYPSVAMDDVYRFAGEITPKTKKDWNGIDIQDPKNLKLVKRITIDEKISLWQDVMKYAHDRGIEIYIFTWNAFVTGAEKYGVSTHDESGVKYMNACMKEFALTYPYLAGVGVTAGERMGDIQAGMPKVKWLYETYGRGLEAAAEVTPERSIRFIFRAHATNLANIDADFASKYRFETETSFKYSGARMFSTTTPLLYENNLYKDVLKSDIKCWMNIRNDDIYCFRWGDPNYAREYLKNLEKYNIAGFYIGPDGYLFGKEFISKNKNLSGELEVKKHWYRESIWGRLAYNPDLDNSLFEDKISLRFPNSNSKELFQVWQKASEIIPLFQCYYYKQNDCEWHVEGCIDEYGFQTLTNILDGPNVDNSKYISIMDYAKDIIHNRECDRITPLQISEQLHQLSNSIIKDLKPLKKGADHESDEYRETLADIEAMAWLGDYYAYKLSAALNFYLYENHPSQEKKAEYKRASLADLDRAEKSWSNYANNADSRYKSQLLARTTYLDWKAIERELKRDRDIVENSKGEPNLRALFFYQENREISIIDDLISKYKDNGYQIVTYPNYQFPTHAYYDIRVMVVNATSTEKLELLRNDGGAIPQAEIDKNGYSVLFHNNTYWIIGKDNKLISKGIEEVLNSLHFE